MSASTSSHGSRSSRSSWAAVACFHSASGSASDTPVASTWTASAHSRSLCPGGELAGVRLAAPVEIDSTVLCAVERKTDTLDRASLHGGHGCLQCPPRRRVCAGGVYFRRVNAIGRLGVFLTVPFLSPSDPVGAKHRVRYVCRSAHQSQSDPEEMVLPESDRV